MKGAIYINLQCSIILVCGDCNDILMISRRQKNFVVDPAVFTCVSMLAKAVGPSIAKDVKELLDPMLAGGLRYFHSNINHFVIMYHKFTSNMLYIQICYFFLQSYISALL